METIRCDACGQIAKNDNDVLEGWLVIDDLGNRVEAADGLMPAHACSTNCAAKLLKKMPWANQPSLGNLD